MLDTFINNASTRLGRKVRATLALLALPLILLYAFIVGSFIHVWEFLKEYFSDLRELIVDTAPDTFRDLIFTIRTGAAI